jgi:type IV pilus assembly protein PilE
MRKGFTLLELIIVIIVLAVLASLAIPRFIRITERARAAEALQQLNVLRGSMERYWARGQSYSNPPNTPTAAMTSAGNCGAGAYNLDADCPNNLPNMHFTYALSGVADAAYTITATRNAVDGGDGISTITINQAGTIAGTGVFVGIR